MYILVANGEYMRNICPIIQRNISSIIQLLIKHSIYYHERKPLEIDWLSEDSTTIVSYLTKNGE